MLELKKKRLNSLHSYYELNCKLHNSKTLRIFLYLVQMRENADQNNSEYGQFLRSEYIQNSSKNRIYWKKLTKLIYIVLYSTNYVRSRSKIYIYILNLHLSLRKRQLLTFSC